MSSVQQNKEFSEKAGQIVGQAQVRREDCKEDTKSSSQAQAQAPGFLESVKNTFGFKNESNTEFNKNPLDLKNPNNTTSPSMPGLPPSDI